MSAKNRGRPSAKADLYKTPLPLPRDSLSVVKERHLELVPRSVLEPGCYNAPFLDAARALWPSIEWSVGVDTEPSQVRSDHIVQRADFLQWAAPHPFDLIVGNLPFSIAEPCIRRSLLMLAPAGLAAFLLRINFLGSEKRVPLWAAKYLRHVIAISPRPSFTEKGNDATEYGVFVFSAEPSPDLPTLLRLDGWRPPKRRVPPPLDVSSPPALHSLAPWPSRPNPSSAGQVPTTATTVGSVAVQEGVHSVAPEEESAAVSAALHAAPAAMGNVAGESVFDGIRVNVDSLSALRRRFVTLDPTEPLRWELQDAVARLCEALEANSARLEVAVRALATGDNLSRGNHGVP